MIKTGGCGGFLASVRDMGVTGQQQHASTVSADEATRGGAGGFFISRGGGTNPGSELPSPAETIVPVQSVKAIADEIAFLQMSVFMGRKGLKFKPLGGCTHRAFPHLKCCYKNASYQGAKTRSARKRMRATRRRARIPDQIPSEP